MNRKGVLLMPEHYDNSKANERQSLLFEMVAERYGFRMIYANEPEIPSDAEIVITFGIPIYNKQGPMADRLFRLDKKVKLISYMEFYRWNEDVENEDVEKENLSKIFDRSDLILGGANENFEEWNSQYMDKFVYFPQFFAPYERYGELGFPEDPINQCLLVGSLLNAEVYPLRNYILQNHDPSRVKVIHSRAGRGFLRKEEYAQFLNSYFCCIATSSCYNMVIAKYLEIPAAGSLLLADECEDLKKLGFRAYEHYVPITMNNVFSQVDLVLSNPKDFLEIRREGTKFVRENHSIFNRFGQLKEIIERVANG